MKIFDTIQAIRPDVDPMPLTKRIMLRESIFGVGHPDPTSTIRARSESGAVVSTAPHGIRVAVARQRRQRGSVLKVVAGLIVTAIAAGVGWSFLTREDDSTTTLQRETVPGTTEPTDTTTTSTVAPFVRTGVDRRSPLVLTPTLLPVDEVSIDPPNPGAATALLTAPDGSVVWLAEFPGPPAPTDQLDVEQIGAIGVGTARNPANGAVPSYQLLTPCGLVLINDAPDVEQGRPAVRFLLESMSIDTDATLDVLLPSGWSVLDIGDSQVSYVSQFQVPTDDGTAALRLVQIPDGSFGQLTFGGRQLQPTTLLGGPAFVDSRPNDPNLVSVYWQDGPTVFNASSADLTRDQIDAFIDSLVPASPEEWTRRFDIAAPETIAPDESCSPQPDFGPTLDP